MKLKSAIEKSIEENSGITQLSDNEFFKRMESVLQHRNIRIHPVTKSLYDYYYSFICTEKTYEKYRVLREKYKENIIKQSTQNNINISENNNPYSYNPSKNPFVNAKNNQNTHVSNQFFVNDKKLSNNNNDNKINNDDKNKELSSYNKNIKINNDNSDWTPKNVYAKMLNIYKKMITRDYPEVRKQLANICNIITKFEVCLKENMNYHKHNNIETIIDVIQSLDEKIKDYIDKNMFLPIKNLAMKKQIY